MCCPCVLQSQSAPPGAYQLPGALGRQVASTKESAPGIKIGTSLRALDYEVGPSSQQVGHELLNMAVQRAQAWCGLSILGASRMHTSIA